MLMIISRGRSLLHYASKENSNVKMIKALIDAGANVKALDFGKQTPLHYAAESNSN